MIIPTNVPAYISVRDRRSGVSGSPVVSSPINLKLPFYLLFHRKFCSRADLSSPLGRARGFANPLACLGDVAFEEETASMSKEGPLENKYLFRRCAPKQWKQSMLEETDSPVRFARTEGADLRRSSLHEWTLRSKSAIFERNPEWSST